MCSGKTGKSIQELTGDFRKVMEPYTATNLKVRPQNVIKDFVNLAGVLNVSHMCMFTRTDKGPYIKFSRFPRGPTLNFKVHNYTLSRDVRSSLKRQVTYDKQYINAPLLILNGFQVWSLTQFYSVGFLHPGTSVKSGVFFFANMFCNVFIS